MEQETQKTSRFIAVVKRISGVMAIVSALALAAMMIITVIDVGGRWLFLAPLEGAFELIGILLVIAGSWGLGYCQLNKANIRITVIFDMFPFRGKSALNIMAYIICIAACVIICWQGSLRMYDYIFKVRTRTDEFEGNHLINAAGLQASRISRMIGLDYFDIIPRKGEYILFDRNTIHLNKILFPAPTKVSKGILVCPTIHGNSFVGPNAQNIVDLDDTSTTTAGLKEILEGGQRLVPNLPIRSSIRNFKSGNH